MRFTPALCAAVLSYPIATRATTVIVGGGEDVATDPYAVAIEGPSAPTLITVRSFVSFGWGVAGEAERGSILPVLVPIRISVTVAGNEFETDVLWNATGNNYTDVEFILPFNFTFVGSGELDFALDGGYCPDCFTGQGSFVAETNPDAGASIDGIATWSDPDPVPEPSSLAVLGIGAMALLRRHRLHVHH